GARSGPMSTCLAGARASDGLNGGAKPSFAWSARDRNSGAVSDTASNRVVLDATLVRGGYIQLYGQIMSTSKNGAGKLAVLDGFGKININNTSGLDIVLNTMDTGLDVAGDGRGVEGVSDITDIRV